MRPGQPEVADGLMGRECVGGGIGGAEDLDVEALEQLTRVNAGDASFSEMAS